MRTDNPLAPVPPWDRLRALLDQARRWAGRRPVVARWGLAIVALTVLVVAGYVASPSDPIGSEWLFDGHRFSRDDATKITSTLVASGIGSKADRQGRIAVPADRTTEAMAVLKKNKLGPRSLADPLDRAAEGALWLGPQEHEQRLNRAREERFELMIERLDGIAQATVTINRERSRRFNRPWNVKALVYLEAQEGQPIPGATIKTIQTMLGSVPDLDPDAVTVVDSQGQVHLSPNNPALGIQSAARAREEDLHDELMKRLDWMEGIKVFVKLTLPDPSARPQSPRPSGNPAPSPSPTPPVAIGVNSPLDAEPQDAAPEAPRPSQGSKVSVFIQMPNSSLLDGYRRAVPGREPSQEDMKAYVARVEQSIRNAVAQVVPASELDALTFDRINVPGGSRPVDVPEPPDARRAMPLWAPAAAGGVLALVLALAVGRMMSIRRPAAVRPPHRPRREAYDAVDDDHAVGAGAAAGPGPSERVRELVRANPGAAAGVLQRWIGQGGHAG